MWSHFSITIVLWSAVTQNSNTDQGPSYWLISICNDNPSLSRDSSILYSGHEMQENYQKYGSPNCFHNIFIGEVHFYVKHAVSCIYSSSHSCFSMGTYRINIESIACILQIFNQRNFYTQCGRCFEAT